VIPEFSSEAKKELIDVIFNNSEDIFGENTILVSFSQNAQYKKVVPDCFVFDLKNAVWCIILIQPSNCRLDGLMSAINEFYRRIENPIVQKELQSDLVKEFRENQKLKARLEGITSLPSFKNRLRRYLLTAPETVIITDSFSEKSKEAWSTLRIEPAILKFVVSQDSSKERKYLIERPCIEELKSTVKIRRPANRGRINVGDSLLQIEYELPILESLIELRGCSKSSDVLAKVQGKMSSKLSKFDLERIPSGSVRWVKKANWRKYVLAQKGFIDKHAGLGIWKITDEGRQFFNEQKVQLLKKT
jgi:hypothetical protein